MNTTTSTTFTDSTVSNGSAYLYKICSADSQNNCTSSYSNLALGTAVSFTDPTIVSIADDSSGATVTAMKAVHITELRTAVNAVRSLAGLSSASWSYSISTGSTIHVEDVRDLRTALNEALTTLNIQTSSYTDSTLVGYSENPLTATTIKAVHVRELRQRVTGGGGSSGSGGSGAGLVYVLSDIQGSTRAVMNNSGSSSAVIARHDYLPFGEEIGSGVGSRSLSQGYNASDTNRWKYGMTERDSTTGLDHTWWRKYESAAGRWTSPDPYNGSMAIASPQSFNRYSYTQNDPVNFIDPSGLCGYMITYINNPDGTTTITDVVSSPCYVNVYDNAAHIRGVGGGGRSIVEIMFQINEDGGGGLDQKGKNTDRPLQNPIQPQKHTRRECVNDAIRKFLGKEAVTAIKREAAQVLAFTLTMTTIFLGSHAAAAGAAWEAGEITAFAAGIEGLHSAGAASLHAGGVAALGGYWAWTFKESYENNKEFMAAVDACPKS